MNKVVEKLLLASQNAIFITVKTDNTGVSANNQFQLSLASSDNQTIIDWGDGSFSTASSTEITHTYTATGVYTLKLYNFTFIPVTSFVSASKDSAKIIDLKIKTKKPFKTTSLGWAFAGTNITEFPYVNTLGITDFYVTWNGCTGFTGFPLIDSSQVYLIEYAWEGCINMRSFSALDLSKVIIANAAWENCPQLIELPLFNFASLQSANYLVENCTNLVNFPSRFNNSNCIAFDRAFNNCALNQVSVDGILTSINSMGLSNGLLGISAGANSTPSATGRSAADALRARGWTVTLNGY